MALLAEGWAFIQKRCLCQECACSRRSSTPESLRGSSPSAPRPSRRGPPWRDRGPRSSPESKARRVRTPALPQELSRTSQPCSCASLSHKNSSASPSPLKNGSVSRRPGRTLLAGHRRLRDQPPGRPQPRRLTSRESLGQHFPLRSVQRVTRPPLSPTGQCVGKIRRSFRDEISNTSRNIGPRGWVIPTPQQETAPP